MTVAPTLVSEKVKEKFKGVKADPSWAFEGLTRRHTAYITHGYHRYPAKFIPQVAGRLIDEYSARGDLVVDPFGGCGTTVVESKVKGRRSVGVDINPVAVLIAEAKETPIEPDRLDSALARLQERLERNGNARKNGKKRNGNAPDHPRIDYWFRHPEKIRLSHIYLEIKKERDKEVKTFLLCGFSNILKNCSIWNQKSNKPTRDFSKEPSDPYKTFQRQLKMMTRGNSDYYARLAAEKGSGRGKESGLKTKSQIECGDARATPVKTGSASLIVTSPPYVTSYEYADLHQLTVLWFEYADDLGSFRSQFIGTAHHEKSELNMNSSIAEDIKQKLERKHKKTATEVATYFSDMNRVFGEMKRILKKGGITSIVIGNTSLKGVKIYNAEVFVEQLNNLGFSTKKIIKRKIPSKILPSVRDKASGRFVKTSSKGKTLAYPTEYILVMKKR